MSSFQILNFFLLAISYETLGQPRPMDACPEPPVQANFTLGRFLGRWYEAYTTGGNPSYRCFTYEFTASNRTLRGSATQEDLDGSLRKNINTIGQFSLEDPAKIRYSVNGGAAQDYQEFFVKWYVLDTDYNNYALIWRCVANNATANPQENAWILGRRPFFSRRYATYLSRRIPMYGLDDLLFYRSPQDRFCTYPTCV